MLLATSLIICSLKRIGSLFAIYKKFDGQFPAESGRKDDSYKITLKYGYDRAVDPLDKWSRKKFRIREKIERPEGLVYRFQMYRFSRFGYMLVHIGLLFVVAGAMISALQREKGFMWLMDGGETNKYFSRTYDIEVPFGYTVRAEGLKQEMHKDGKVVKDWFSTLIINKGGSEVARKRIEVNNPLSYEGLSFYQSSWSQGYSFRITVTEISSKKSEDFYIMVGNSLLDNAGSEKTYTFGDGKLHFRIDSFYPHFAMGSGGFITQSNNLDNPAVVIRAYWSGLTEARRKVLFSRFPDLDFGKMRSGDTKTENEPFTLVLRSDIKTVPVTGIEISRDPGTAVVYIGFYFITVGIIIGFYFSHRKIWMRLTKSKDAATLEIYGTASRNKYQFEKYLENLVKDLESFLSDKTETTTSKKVTKKN
jgi:cytochrome c biogenesis protein